MKKVLLVTIFDNSNFGTYLQALALGTIVGKYDAEVEVLRYERRYGKSSGRLESSFLYGICKLLYNVLLGNGVYFLQRIRCRRFVGRYLKISRLYCSYDQIVENPPVADVYLTGSDQVWNTTHNHGIDKTFYLGFVPAGGMKIAYAASIGMNFIPEEYKEETRQLLLQYRGISVREKSNVRLLEDIGVHAKMVLDPTLLFTVQDWKRYFHPKKFSRPYVLVYSVETKDCDMLVGTIARMIADKNGYDVIEISYMGGEKEIPYCDKHVHYAIPTDFLSYMYGASFVVVSSFHGTAFSINFNKPFITVAPERFSSRIDSLLQLTNLTERKVSVYNEEQLNRICDTKIDYCMINSVLEEEREKSIAFIKKGI